MKLGLSSYSFRPLLQNGTMQMEDVFAWIRDHGAEHLELATFSMAPAGSDVAYDLAADGEAVARLVAASRDTGVPISGLCIAAEFDRAEPGQRQAAIERVKRHIDLCDRLGTQYLRHDVVPWGRRAGTVEFERDFAGIAAACQEVADYAQRFGVTTSVEDHGFMFNAPERLKRLVHAVDRPNFAITLDVGNFLCVDEDAAIATRACLPQASFVHLKDFYVRHSSPGPGWLETLGGRFIRGTVFGFGDLPTATILKDVVASGYSGFVTLEYEGNEPTLYGCETGLNNIRRILAEIAA